MDLSPGSLFASLVFGLVGFGAWRYGRARQSARPMVLGAALVLYPWFVSDPAWLWGVGLVLTVLVFVP